MPQATIPFAHILHAARGGFFDVVQRLLEHPLRINWGAYPVTMQGTCQQLHRLLPPELCSLLVLSRTAAIVLRPEYDRAREKFLPPAPEIAPLLGAIPVDDLLTKQWQHAPVIVVDDGGIARIITILMAVSPSTNDIFCPGFSDPSREAAEAAFCRARQLSGRDVFFSCLAVTGPDHFIRHSSLGLPLALRAMSMITGERCYNGMAATGALSRTGSGLLAIDSLPAKAACADLQGYSLLLYPAANEPADLQAGDILAIPVADLEEAWLWARLYAPGREDMLRRLAMALATPHDFIAHCTTFPADVLAWLRQNDRCAAILDAICSDREMAEELAGQLSECIRDECYSYARGEALAAILTDEEQLETMAEHSTLAALTWCGGHITLANHRGDVDEVETWFARCEKLRPMAFRLRPEGVELYARIINRFYGVFMRHSRYDFRPEMHPRFAETLEQLQEEYARDCERYGPGTDYALGAMLATRAQNFGFCGPAHHAQLCRDIGLAAQCFGNGEVASLTHHWRRLFCYRLFALLDRQDSDQNVIRKNLLSYLGINDIRTPIAEPDRLDRFHLFALCRAMAERPGLAGGRDAETNLLDMLVHRLPLHGRYSSPPTTDIHPWPLVYYNLGRIYQQRNDLDRARHYWRQAITLCLAGEETLQAMALLPMAALHGNSVLTKQDKEHYAAILTRTLPKLHQSHFAPLVRAGNMGKALDLVHRIPARFFPFTYR